MMYVICDFIHRIHDLNNSLVDAILSIENDMHDEEKYIDITMKYNYSPINKATI